MQLLRNQFPVAPICEHNFRAGSRHVLDTYLQVIGYERADVLHCVLHLASYACFSRANTSVKTTFRVTACSEPGSKTRMRAAEVARDKATYN